MSAQNDTQAAFMEAMNGLKEYAKVNGGFITKDDVLSYFKDLDLDDGKLQMVYGYLMANNIKIKGAASEDNEFLKMMDYYAENFGPLNYFNIESKNYWTWVSTPMPWEVQ